MEFSEVNIDPLVLKTYEEQKAWLSVYSKQLKTFNEVPNVESIDTENTYKLYLEGSISIKSLFDQNYQLKEKIEKLENFLQEKEKALVNAKAKFVSDEIMIKSKAKVTDDELTLYKQKFVNAQESFLKTQKDLADVLEENTKVKIDSEKEELKARSKLLLQEIHGLYDKLQEKEKIIQSHQTAMQILENEKLKALNLYQTKEEKIREEVKSEYNILEITSQSEFYNKKMKEYQNKYLNAKTHESELEEQLLKTLNENFELESSFNRTKTEKEQITNAYFLLKKDYEYISIKYKALSDQFTEVSESFNRESKVLDCLKKENNNLLQQLRALLENKSETIFTYTSVEDLLIKQSQILSQIEELTKENEKLKAKNLSLSRSLETFKKPKETSTISIEEPLPIIENELSLSREQFVERLCLQKSRLLTEIIYLEKKIELLESSNSALKSEINSLTNQNKILLQTLNNFENKNIHPLVAEKYNTQIKALEDQLDQRESGAVAKKILKYAS